MKDRKPRIWKVENGELIEVSPAQLRAEEISSEQISTAEISRYLTDEEIYWMMRKPNPPRFNDKNE